MRALSSPTSTAAALPFTQPGHLVQLGFTPTLRYSSRGDVTWNSLAWQNNNLAVGALQELPNGGTSLTITIGNSDGAFGVVCLGQAPQELAVSVWAFYEGAVALADPVPIFAGVIDSCDITEAAVTLQLSDVNTNTLFIPRQRITRATGFNRLIPAGRVIQFNGDRLEIVKG